MTRTASADAVFEAFDKKIEDYLRRNRKAIEQQYKSAAGRPVDAPEFDSFFSGLGDALYAGIQPDPQHLSRFVDFYAGDQKLEQAVGALVESAATAYAPGRAASAIASIADALDRARRPSMAKLSAALDSVLSRI